MSVDHRGEREAAGYDAVALITRQLDPALAPFGFAGGQGSVGISGPIDPSNPAPPVDGQVIYCRAFPDGSPGCDDVVVDLLSVPRWHVRTVRDWDDPYAPWTLEYGDDEPLEAQLPRIVHDVLHRLDPG